MVSAKQKEAIRFCEDVLGIRYAGNRESLAEVSRFLGRYLKKASSEYNRRKDRESARLRNFYDVYGDVVSRNKNRRG